MLVNGACSHTPVVQTEAPAPLATLPEEAVSEETQTVPDTIIDDIVIVEPALPTNIWDRIRSGFSFPEQNNPRIDRELKWYTKHPRYMERVCERARPFMHYIVEVLDEQQIPMELALLPIVESAFQPFAYSSGRAAGLWQFIPSTGKEHGLKQNWWYDGRRDAYTSTRAAARYLLRLNRILHDDWLYALAGYNAGPGNVLKAIKRNKRKNRPIDYWNLNLPKETEAYVPKLLALKEIVSDPDKYGITLCDIPDEQAIELVKLNGQLDLAVAAELAEISLDELHTLNSGFNRWATDPDGPHHLLVPYEKADKFRHAESNLPQEDRVRWKRHKVKSGETLGHIASRHGTTVSEIIRANKLKSSRIRVSQNLLIPTSRQSRASYALSVEQRQEKILNKKGNNKQIYVVRDGDSWWSIARRYNVTTRKLARWNAKSPLDPLYPGQKLAIWRQADSLKPKTVSNSSRFKQKVRYPVRQGDSLYTIARKFRVGVNDIVRWNQIKKNKYLQPGQQLVIYIDLTQQTGYP